MKTFSRKPASRLLALLAAFALAFALGSATAQAARPYSQQELDRMLAPIALYPDALLSQILVAATYPLEVIEAARWARNHSELSGEAARRAADAEDWDASVKALLEVPLLLEQMRANLQWTQALGDAFLLQQAQVMDTVHTLRRQAEAAGAQRSYGLLRAVPDGPNLPLQSSIPRIVFVAPLHETQAAHRTWRGPDNRTIYVHPSPGHYVLPRPPPAPAVPIDRRSAVQRPVAPPVWHSYVPPRQYGNTVQHSPDHALPRSAPARMHFHPPPGAAPHAATAQRHLPPAHAPRAEAHHPRIAARHEQSAKMQDNRRLRQPR